MRRLRRVPLRPAWMDSDPAEATLVGLLARALLLADGLTAVLICAAILHARRKR